MATVALPSSSAELRERRFFLIMAVAIAVTVIVAFSLFRVAGISSFGGSPWWVHVHAVTFMGWIAFYVLQNTLVFKDDIALHRRLGRIGAVYAVWMVLVGLVLTPLTLAVGRSPPFFTPPYFLALDWINIAVFGGLVYAAIRNRKRTDWHRRLMLCATICVIAPALGRLIVLSGNAMTAPVNVATLLLYVVVAMLFDWNNRGRVHPAYFWGAGALILFAAATETLAILPFFAASAGRIAG
jgi:hypothetical protein